MAEQSFIAQDTSTSINSSAVSFMSTSTEISEMQTSPESSLTVNENERQTSVVEAMDHLKIESDSSMTTENNATSPPAAPDPGENWLLYRARTRSAKRKLVSCDPIVISSDSDEVSDIQIQQYYAKKDRISDCYEPASRIEHENITENCVESPLASEVMMPIVKLVDNQENQELGQESYISDTNNLLEVVDNSTGQEILNAFESTSNNRGKDDAENSSTNNGSIAVIIDGVSQAKPTSLLFGCESGSDSDDSIDMLVKRRDHWQDISATKLFQCDSSNRLVRDESNEKILLGASGNTSPSGYTKNLHGDYEESCLLLNADRSFPFLSLNVENSHQVDGSEYRKMMDIVRHHRIKKYQSASDDEFVTTGRYGVTYKASSSSASVINESIAGKLLPAVSSSETENCSPERTIMVPLVTSDDDLTVERLHIGDNENESECDGSNPRPSKQNDKLSHNAQRKRKHSAAKKGIDSDEIPVKRPKMQSSPGQMEKSPPKTVMGKVGGFFKKIANNLREQRKKLNTKFSKGKRKLSTELQGTSAGTFTVTSYTDI